MAIEYGTVPSGGEKEVIDDFRLILWYWLNTSRNDCSTISTRIEQWYPWME